MLPSPTLNPPIADRQAHELDVLHACAGYSSLPGPLPLSVVTGRASASPYGDFYNTFHSRVGGRFPGARKASVRVSTTTPSGRSDC